MVLGDPKSKKHSDTNSDRQPDPIFFVERSLGKTLAVRLREDGLKVEAHSDHFTPGAPDEVWLREAGDSGWVVLTADKRIRYRKSEKEALISAGVACFVLVSGNLTGELQYAVIKKALPAILRHLSSNTAPFIAIIRRDGSVVPVFPSE